MLFRLRAAAVPAVIGAVALALAACTGGDTPSTPTLTATGTGTPVATTDPATGTPSASPTGTPPPSVDPRPVGVEPMMDVTLTRPVDVFLAAGDRALYVVDQSGVILRVTGGAAETYLDLRDRVNAAGSEEGLLSAQLDPDVANNHLWAYYSAANPRRTVLSRFTWDAQGVVDPQSELVILEVAQPFANHNGGAIRFGPDGMLYLGLGDGGDRGDPEENGQDPTALLGSIIRIDVRDASAGSPYRIPADNPRLGGADPTEVWAYGLRNPWRMEFDPATGALWVGDVGQNAVEEISIATAGANLGWNVMEGDRCYLGVGCDQAGLTPPVLTYEHGGGRCSVTGGPVVRGSTVPELEGNYLFADYCSGELWAVRADLESDGPVLIASGLGNVAAVRQVAESIVVLSFGRPPLQLVSP